MRPPDAMARSAALGLMTVGVAIALWSFGANGIHDVLAIVRHLGIEGLLWYCLYSLAVFVLLGGAWMCAAGQHARTIGVFSWARLIREATSDLLPFSQIGGIVVGVRTLTRRHLSNQDAYASVVVDIATDIASQLVFTLVGLACLSVRLNGSAGATALVLPTIAGTSVLLAILAVLGAGPRALRVVAVAFGRFVPGAAAWATRIGTALQTMYRHRARVAAAFGLNLAAWFASAIGAYLVLRLMHVGLSLGATIALESLVFLLRSVAFMIPGGIGVQEAAYLMLGPILGLPAEAALALALAKRGRDIAIGVPAIAAWQVIELRIIAVSRTARLDAGVDRPRG